MDSVVFAVDPGGHVLYFGLLVLVGSAVGLLIYLGLTRAHLRRESFRDLSVPKPVAAIVALLVTGPILWYAYTDSWSYFYAVRSTAAGISLEFHFPERSRRLEAGGVVQVELVTEIRKGVGVPCRLRLTTSAGEIFESTLIRRQRAEEYRDALRAVLAGRHKREGQRPTRGSSRPRDSET